MKLSIEEIGSPYYKENRVENPSETSLKIIYKAIDLLKASTPKSTVLEVLTQEYKRSKTKIPRYIQFACQVIEDEFNKRDKYVFGLHLSRYDEEIERLLTFDYESIDVEHRTRIWIANHLDILETMRAKEELLQLHKKSMVVKLVQNNTVIVKREPNAFKLDGLTLVEKIELLNLIKKSKINYSDKLGVILREKNEEVEIQEVVVVDEKEKVNIESIKEVNEPSKWKKLKDSTEQNRQSTLLSIRDKIQRRLEESAREGFLKAGSKTVK